MSVAIVYTHESGKRSPGVVLSRTRSTVTVLLVAGGFRLMRLRLPRVVAERRISYTGKAK